MNKSIMRKVTFVAIIVAVITCLNTIKSSSGPLKHQYKRKLYDSTIVGPWIADQDSTFLMVFQDEHTCMKFYGGILKETDSVIISNTSPQCGVTVPVNINTTYMQLINKANPSQHFCYEITGLTSLSLAFRSVDMGPVILFYRP